MATYNEISGKLINVTGDKTDPSFDHIVAGTDVIYDSEYPLIVNGYVECDTTPISDPTGNPHEQGWCEEEMVGEVGTGNYILTEDTTVELDKNYYKPIGARQDDINNQLRTTMSDLSGVVLHANEYNEATIHEGDNPQANGWYELSGTTYVLTTDTTIVSGKTYYIRVAKITSNEDKIIGKEDGYIPTAGAVGRAMGANFEDNLQSTSTVKGLTANMGRVLNEKKADINGYYETMSVGSAKNLDGETINSEAYLIRPTGGENNEVVSGLASIVGMEGNSQVWNQLLDTYNITKYEQIQASGTIGINNEIITITIPNRQYAGIIQKFSILTTHKYFDSFCYKTDIDGFQIGFGIYNDSGAGGHRFQCENTSGNWLTAKSIFTPMRASNFGFFVQSRIAGLFGSIEFKNIYIIDLTLLGIDNLTTVAEVEAWLAEHVGIKPYYAYNKGTILSANTLGFKTYSRNLLNPSNGLAKLIPYTHATNSNKYTVKGIPTGVAVTYTPDNTGVAVDVTEAITDNTFDISSYGNGVLYIPNATVNTYVCMKYDGAMNDEIVPYKESTYNFDITKVYGKTGGSDEYVQCFPNGMRSAGSVHDTLTASDAINKVKSKNLGELTYSYHPDYGFYVNNSDINILCKNGTGNIIVNKKYEAVPNIDRVTLSQSNFIVAKGVSGIGSSWTNTFTIKDSDYNNPTLFKSAMSTFEINYELANPITYTNLIYRDGGVDRPLREVLVNLNVDNRSMEEQLITDYDEQTNQPTSVPATIQTKYSIDAVEAIKTLEETTYTETEVRATFSDLLDKINTNCSSILGGTFSIQNPTGKTLTFDFTANASINSIEENPETI